MVNCQLCSQPATHRCSRCHQVGYCARKCQKNDWKRHRKQCSQIEVSSACKHYFKWSKKWEYSFPGFSDDGLSVSCFAQNSLVTSENHFTDQNSECMLKIFTHSDKLKVGICTKNSKGRVDEMWMYSTSGRVFGPQGFEDKYGKAYSKGDVVTVKFKNSSLSFDLNGASYGVAFNGIKQTPVYLCVLLNNAFNFDVGEMDDKLLENRPSAVQLVYQE